MHEGPSVGCLFASKLFTSVWGELRGRHSHRWGVIIVDRFGEGEAYVGH